MKNESFDIASFRSRRRRPEGGFPEGGRHDHSGHDHSNRERGQRDISRRGGGRMRRGDMRGLVLAGLLDGPTHGYELIQRLEEKTGGQWRPSPGSIYPMLQMLEEAGLTTSTEQDGRTVHSLTEQGRAEADPAKLDEFGADLGVRETGIGFRREMDLLHLAVQQVRRGGTPDQIERAVAVLSEARKAIHLMLAE